jgi:hypothetical protein
MIGTGVVIPLWTLAGRKATKKNGTGWLKMKQGFALDFASNDEEMETKNSYDTLVNEWE